MSSLRSLRKRLQSVGRQRLLLDWLTALLRFAIDACGVLLLLFAIDFALRLESAARMILLAAAAAFLLWRIYVRARSLRAWPEGAVDIALLLERRQPLAGDVVAGLQFEQSRLSLWGSEALAEQVAEQAACVESQLDYRSLIPLAPFRRQVLWAACVSAGIVTIALCFSAHSQAFAARLLLRNAAYPTRTRIVEIAINGKRLLDSDATARVVEGTPLSIAVRARGVLPASGTVRISSLEGEDATLLTLTRDASHREQDSAVYAARGPQLKADAVLSVELGDARSGEMRIFVIRRPIVELTIEATPPHYVRSALPSESTQDRYVSFLQGSDVRFSLRCTNGKQLRAVDLEWSSDSGIGKVSFSQAEPGGTVWHCQPEETPFQSLAKAVQFAVNVLDEDGLSMQEPQAGKIEIRPDHPPVASLRTEHHLVVPMAKPILHYDTSDDFGVLQLVFQVSRWRNGGEEPIDGIELNSGQGDFSPETRVAGALPLDLNGMDVRIGDRVLVKLHANDALGLWPNYRFSSEAVEIEIADEARVLKAILGADAAAERLLTDAIEEESVLKESR